MGQIEAFNSKVVYTLVMLALTVFFCYLPWFVHRKWRKAIWLISLLNCVAGGVVLGALLMHMIPEIVAPHSNGNCEYQWGCFAAGVSFLLLFSVDRLFLSHAHCENEETPKGGHGGHSHDDHSHSNQADPKNIPHAHHHHGKECNHDHDHDHNDHTHSHSHARQPSSIESEELGPHEDCHEADIMGGCHMEGIRTSKSQLQTYVFVFCLSLHSLLEGLGVAGKDESSLGNFLFGLFAHKWIEAFALGVTVLSARFSATKSFFLMGFYSILTPLGIVLGMLSDYLSASSGTSHIVLNRVMNGLSAGSFLFVSCIEMIPPEFHTKNQSTPVKFMAIVIGFMIMAIASHFHSH